VVCGGTVGMTTTSSTTAATSSTAAATTAAVDVAAGGRKRKERSIASYFTVASSSSSAALPAAAECVGEAKENIADEGRSRQWTNRQQPHSYSEHTRSDDGLRVVVSSKKSTGSCNGDCASDSAASTNAASHDEITALAQQETIRRPVDSAPEKAPTTADGRTKSGGEENSGARDNVSTNAENPGEATSNEAESDRNHSENTGRRRRANTGGRRNIVYELMDRSLLGRRPPGVSSGESSFGRRRNRAWKVPPWITISQFPGRRGPATAAIAVRHLAWDDMGVLLATGSSDSRGMVQVYDWDMVWSSDRDGRNKQARNEPGAFDILPILTFFTHCSISCMRWNPFNQDELAIGISGGKLLLYDVATINGWLQQGSVGSQPRRVFDCSGSGARTGVDATVAVLFVDSGARLLVASGQTLVCFDTAVSNKILWKFNWKRISVMSPVDQDTVLVGSKCGHFALIDWKHTQRSSFSRIASPTILCEWLSYRGLLTPTGSTGHMSIHCLVVETLSAAPVATNNQYCRFRVTWITSCGWVLTSVLDSTTGPKRFVPQTTATILFSTNPVALLNARGEHVKRSNPLWSLPLGACAGHGAGDLLVWEKVPDAIEVLPHHDKRVIGSYQPQTARPKSKPGLMMMWRNGAFIQSCTLSRRRGKPVSVAIHPGHEWIVVATERDGLYALSAR